MDFQASEPFGQPRNVRYEHLHSHPRRAELLSLINKKGDPWNCQRQNSLPLGK